MKVATDRLIIRPFIESDLEGSHRLFILEDAMKWMVDGLHHAIALPDGKFIGYITVDPDSEEDREDTKELGFALLPEYRGNGYMKEAVSAVLGKLKQEGIHYVWACCFEGNANSENLIKNCGFTLINKGIFYVESEDHEYSSMEYRIDLSETI